MTVNSVPTDRRAEYPQRVFAVVSWGSAATRWLTTVFNRHPDILALHNMRARLLRSVERLDAADYLNLVEHQGIGLKMAGDIHGISIHETDALRSTWGDRIRFASVVRHPVQRGISSTKFWIKAARPSDPAWFAHPSLNAVRRHLTSTTAIHFARSMSFADNIVRETALGPVFRMEDLTADLAFVWKLIEHLSAGVLARDPELDRVIAVAGKVGIHGSASGSRDLYVEEPWQHELYEQLVSDEGKRLYRELGYEIRRPAGPVVFPPAGPLPPDPPSPPAPQPLPFLKRLKWAAKFLLNRLPDNGRFR